MIQNRPGKPILSLDFAKGKSWNMSEAVHAGPVLITDGKINITTEEEVFFNTPIAGVEPRSAIGYTKNGELIIMVVDGRQADSRGVYLEELALLMSQFHCLEAMNLDGGGSIFAARSNVSNWSISPRLNGTNKEFIQLGLDLVR